MIEPFFFGIYPYIAASVFLIGSWIRFDRDQYSWKTDSSQFLDKRNLRLASNLFHVGILAIFLGHLVGLLTPHSVFQAVGVPDMAHQWAAIMAGSLFGTLSLIGALLLWVRRTTSRRVRAAGRPLDTFTLGWILATLLLGLSTIPVSINHALHGNPGVMIVLADYVQSVLTLRADPDLLAAVDTVFKVHMVFGMTVFLVFPFTRLVHIWSAPFGYLTRAWQVVRSARRHAA